jgi:hypothetical protein
MGGVVIVDDYGLDGCRLAIEDYFSGYKYPDMILVDDHVYYFVKDVEVEKKTIIKSK